jgi:hypothetical protein
MLSAFLIQFLVFAPYRRFIIGEKSTSALIQALLWNIKNLPQTLAARGKVKKDRD